MKNNKFSKLGFVVIALGSFAISLSSCTSTPTKGDEIKAFFSGTGGKVELDKDVKDLKLNDIVKISISNDSNKYLKTLTLNGFDISMNLSVEAYTKELIFEFEFDDIPANLYGEISIENDNIGITTAKALSDGKAKIGSFVELENTIANKDYTLDYYVVNGVRLEDNRFYVNSTKEYKVETYYKKNDKAKNCYVNLIAKNGSLNILNDSTSGIYTCGKNYYFSVKTNEKYSFNGVFYQHQAISTSEKFVYSLNKESEIYNLEAVYEATDVVLSDTTIEPSRGTQGTIEAYYEPCRGLKGPELKAALHNIIKGHTEKSYGNLFEAYDYIDADPTGDHSGQWYYTYEGYEDAQKTDHSNNGCQREHTWAKSRGDFGDKEGPGADYHHIRPCYGALNNSRGNKEFGEVGSNYTNYSKYASTRPQIVENRYDSNVFEPKDSFKGDVARMMFYMATRYEGDDKYVDLELSAASGRTIDSNRYYDFTDSTLNGGTPGGEHGDFTDLYKWTMSGIDPVSDEEMYRNNQIDKLYQHNRNPFIDHPEFIKMIYDKNYSGPGALLDK